MLVCGKKLLVFVIVPDEIVLQAGGFTKVDAPCGENQCPADELYKCEGNIRAGKKEHSKIQENIDSADCIVKIAEFPPPCSQNISIRTCSTITSKVKKTHRDAPERRNERVELRLLNIPKTCVTIKNIIQPLNFLYSNGTVS